MPSAGERPRLADVEDPERSIVAALLCVGGARELRRLADGLVREPERAPMHCHHGPGAEHLSCLDRLLGAHVLWLHEPARLIGADGEYRPIDWAGSFPDFGEAVEKR